MGPTGLIGCGDPDSNRAEAATLEERVAGARVITMGRLRTRCPPIRPVGDDVSFQPDADGIPNSSENTASLLVRVRGGDEAARERLFARYLPVLRRWAHHRLPRSARDLRDTDDLVQDTLLGALRRLDRFEHRGEGAFLAYLRQILLNAIRDGVRRAAVRPQHTTLDEAVPDPAPSALEQAIGREVVARFETALAKLEPEQREAIILRMEFRFSHQQIADALGKTSANTARMTVTRAMVALSKAMHEA
jgi:RNA polymerase sigma-70 factor, ECF subfamily